MKHRSVISFVIVAAALFSLPQLSHDLRALKGAVGLRLHRELLHAFLNLPAGEPAAAATTVRPSESLLASCPQERPGAPAAKSFKVGPSSRAEGRTGGKSFDQSAMLGDPANDPISQRAGLETEKAAGKAATALPDFKANTEVAMIVPPDTGIGPGGLAATLASSDVARAAAARLRFEAGGQRVAYAATANFETYGPEWQKSAEEAARKLDASLSGAYEFRVLRDGAKVKVLKVRCGNCPATAPRLPRAPRQLGVDMLVPAPVVPAQLVGE